MIPRVLFRMICSQLSGNRVHDLGPLFSLVLSYRSLYRVSYTGKTQESKPRQQDCIYPETDSIHIFYFSFSQQTQKKFQTFLKGHMAMFYNIKTSGQQNIIIRKWR